jgi:hypothetical protein
LVGLLHNVARLFNPADSDEWEAITMAETSRWEQNNLDEILRTIVSRHQGQTVNVYAIARIIEDEYPAVSAIWVIKSAGLEVESGIVYRCILLALEVSASIRAG